MSEEKNQGQYVFGLDIGTRSIVGTVGFREGDTFNVAAQVVKEHETRAMLDGQIHDINAVGSTINAVKKALEKKLDIKLTDVCIAAAGRVLRTIETHVDWELEKETVITPEEIAALTSMGIEKAYEQFQETNDTGLKFYCVGNSVIRYYLNNYQIGNLENHKAKTVGADIIATFLPDDVVDGLYKAVEIAGLTVVNMTLEPIAAITVAIPEMYRMLNIALVDVGAGTSDICITKDGCIVAYGMIPSAGDGLTEIIAKYFLVDFGTAEKIKRGIATKTSVEFKDIMGLPQKAERKTVLKILDEALNGMTKLVSDKIKELNGGKPVSAVFVVGGGGKIAGYTKKLAGYMDIPEERCAIRGEEVMQKIHFREKIKKDSLLVTPIGICLNYYDQSNNFIYVTFNDERIKLYNNNSVAVVDAAMHASFPNDRLFPRRGPEINYSVNGVSRIARGQLGEPAVITVNGEEVDIHHEIKANDVIVVKDSTMGPAAVLPISKIPEVKSTITVKVNGSKILLPRLVVVNGEPKSVYYDVQDGDKIVLPDFYTVKQVREFMDVTLDESMTVVVNNEEGDDNTLVYDNFSIEWALKSETKGKKKKPTKTAKALADEDSFENLPDSTPEELEETKRKSEEKNASIKAEKEAKEKEEAAKLKEELGITDEEPEETAEAEETEEKKEIRDLHITVNKKPVTLKGKAEYVFVDVFDVINFDTKNVKGKALITNVNGSTAEYLKVLSEGDVLDIYWDK